MSPAEQAAFSVSAAGARAMLEYFSPEARVARRFPDLPAIEHRAQRRLSLFSVESVTVTLRALRIKEYLKEGVPYPVAVEAALEAERRPQHSELAAWRKTR